MERQKLVVIVCCVLLVAGYAFFGLSSNIDNPSPTTVDDSSNVTLAEVLGSNRGSHEAEGDYVWNDFDVITITLDSGEVGNDDETSVIIDGTTVTITSAGTYSISGTLNDGQVIVDTNDKGVVRLILNGITIRSSTNAPIWIENAEKTIVVLANNTENYVADSEGNEDKGALSSNDDLTICGTGSLTVIGNTNDAIRSDDGLVIKSGTIVVTSVDDGIRGKDYLIIKGGDITVNSDGDGLKSDNNKEETKGYIYIEDGEIDITSTQGDAITAQTDLLIAGGTITLTTGGGSNAPTDGNASTKGLKAGAIMVINDGVFTIDSCDDSIHSNGKIIINNGTYDIASGDDGVHADTSLTINGGVFDVSQSYEGMESAIITVNNGYIQIDSSDDGLNVVGGNAGLMPGGPGGPGGRQDRDYTSSDNYYLNITGGFIAINSGGDGFDINGYIEMSGGVVIINGPTSNFNGALDFISFKITGGTLVAVGSAGMAMAPGAFSSQLYVHLRFNSVQSANILLNIQTASGEDVLTFEPMKNYQSVVFSSPELVLGSYKVYLGGSSTGNLSHGLYEDGAYSGGSEVGGFTLS